MKAVILNAGFGVRLRPLTLSVPKPLIEFANKPILVRQLEALREAGCTEVILAIGYASKVMEAFILEWEEKLGIRIVLSEEQTLLGTGGALALAKSNLQDEDKKRPFFMINGDILCQFPLSQMLSLHNSTNAEATLLVTEVSDPSRFGAVVMEKSGKVECFVEKPSRTIGARINAGVYVLQPSILDRIQVSRPTSLEKEILPTIAAEAKLYALQLSGFWTDLGEPDDYRSGITSYLLDANRLSLEALSKGDGFQGNVLIGEGVTIGAGCQIGPNVCIGHSCVIGTGVRLKNCTVMSGAIVNDFAYCADAILGQKSNIGRWCRLENGCTFGEDVACKDELMFNGAVVLPHKSLNTSLLKPGIIL